MALKIHHIGIACRNIEKALKAYKKLFNVVEETPVVHDELQNADLCLLKTDTGLDVEFISGEQVSNLLKQKISYYHLCYSTNAIEETISQFENNGALLVSPLKPAVLFNGNRVAFLMTSSGLIELVEE